LGSILLDAKPINSIPEIASASIINILNIISLIYAPPNIIYLIQILSTIYYRDFVHVFFFLKCWLCCFRSKSCWLLVSLPLLFTVVNVSL
jgi:hypothetical protein